MAVSPAPPVTLETKQDNPELENSVLQSSQPDLPPPPAPAPVSSSSPLPTTTHENPNPNPNPNPPSTVPTTTTNASPFPSFQSFTPPPIITPPPSAPSFRPITPVPIPVPQYTPLPNPNTQNPNFQNPHLQPPPPGSIMRPTPPGMYQVPPPNPSPMPPYAQLPNGYAPMPNQPPGTIPPPGIPRYPTHYTPMVRPAYPPRPPGPMGMLPPLSRPPIPGIRGVPPILPPSVISRPPVPIVPPTEKPQTTVYVGKVAPTVENDFILSLLRLCGPVKSWKRAQDPSNGTPKTFGFCEFESAEGVLRALRLLTRVNVDGYELMMNVNQATRGYLERYVEKKTEREKLKEAEAEAESTKQEEENAPGVEKKEPPKPIIKEENEEVDQENQDSTKNFGIVTDEDREADRDALEKLTNMLEERLKTKPLPPPPMLPPADGAAKSNSEAPSKSRDENSDVDIMKNGDDKNDEETTSENKPSSENDRPETSSPDMSRKHDRRSRERDREWDLKREEREKERELERYEKKRERERIKRESDRDKKNREAERLYSERLKKWEFREKSKANQRNLEKTKEKERERQRKEEIMDQEDGTDDRRRHRSSVLEEKRRKRKREKEEDLADRVREEEEIAEAKRRAIEEQQQKKDEEKDIPVQMANGGEKSVVLEKYNGEGVTDVAEQYYESDSGTGNHVGDVIMKNGVDDSSMSAVAVADTSQSSNVPARKLGFGLVGAGKRTTVPSVFHEEDEDEADKDKKMRPLVPIDYSTEEIQAVQPPLSGAPPPNLAAAAEFAKRISNVNPKEERSDVERHRSRRSGDRSSQGERDRKDEDSHRTRNENKDRTLDKERDREHVSDKLKTPENKKLLDAKQLIDMIPKTKEELFSYEINWPVYNKHELHERMRPWISKKITEFLGEEEVTLVEYIVNGTKQQFKASQMLEMLQPILDDESEMFVLKMWRMLIFEIKKVETGLALKPKVEK